MATESERAKILEMIESGTITAEEGMTLLNTLDGLLEAELVDDLDFENERSEPVLEAEDVFMETKSFAAETETYEGEIEVLAPPAMPPSDEEIQKWKRWWVVPLWIGAGITVIGGLLMYWAFSTSRFGFWFACAWFPFLLGVGVLALAWGSKTSPWLHVRVQQAPGETPQRIAISFPLPVRLIVWGFKMFGHYIPHMEGVNIEEIILALKDVAKDGTPFFVDVDEGENGEKVQVFIG